MTDLEREIIVAETIARLVHFGQARRFNGEAFIDHPAAVAALVTDRAKPTAWLHDVLEDTPITPAQLLAAGISTTTIEAVILLTRDPRDSYDEYIIDIIHSGNDIARGVKYADLKHNLNGAPPSLQKRYTAALARLEKAGVW